MRNILLLPFTPVLLWGRICIIIFLFCRTCDGICLPFVAVHILLLLLCRAYKLIRTYSYRVNGYSYPFIKSCEKYSVVSKKCRSYLHLLISGGGRIYIRMCIHYMIIALTLHTRTLSGVHTNNVPCLFMPYLWSLWLNLYIAIYTLLLLL